MNDKHALSARVKAAFEGCYESSRAAALSGVPVSTVYLWARTGVVEPSVSPTKIKLWSYADLMALRIGSPPVSRTGWVLGDHAAFAVS